MIARKYDVLDPSRECIANADDGNITMRLLVVAWQQKRPPTVQIHWKGAIAHQLQIMIPFEDECTVKLSCTSFSKSLLACNEFAKWLVDALAKTSVVGSREARCD